MSRSSTHYNNDTWTDVHLFVGYTYNADEDFHSNLGGGERISLNLRMEQGLQSITVDADASVHTQLRRALGLPAALEVHMGGSQIPEDGTTFSENGVSVGATLSVAYHTLGEAAEQVWVRKEGVSPYCDAVYVAASVEELFECNRVVEPNL